MKCTLLIASGSVSACSALDRPYVPSLFELGEYCKTADHRKCPFYLRGIIYTNQAESNTGRASCKCVQVHNADLFQEKR